MLTATQVFLKGDNGKNIKMNSSSPKSDYNHKLLLKKQ